MGPLVALLLLGPAGASSWPSEGERVASVVVDAPSAEAERLLAFVELGPGQPYRAEALRHAVELIHATGEYEDVSVEAERGEDGLALVVRLSRAPLFADVVAEGDRVLDPGALRRLSRLRAREPLWPARLERAAAEARQALVEDGYPEAQVAASARASAEGADAVFRIDAGPRAHVAVARIAFEAGPPALVARLAALVAPRPGEVYRPGKAEEAARRMRQELLARGYWRAEVGVQAAREPGQPGVWLAFLVDAGPPMTLEFRGWEPPRALVREIAALLRESGLQADVREQGTERLESELLSQGRRAARVVAGEEPRGAGAALVYEVEPGPTARVGSIRLAGDEEDLSAVALSTRLGGPLEEAVLAADARALQRALEERGYVDARVEAEVPEGGGDLPVVFRLRPGPRRILASVTVEAPVPFPAETPARELNLQPGHPYRLRDLARDRDALLAAYRDAGYPQVEVTPEVAYADDGAAHVVLRTAPGPLVRVDRVVIAGLRGTREEVVRRELLVKEGEPLGLHRVLESQRRLGALGIFERVSVAEIDPETVGKRSVIVAAEEAPRTTVAYGIGYAERDLLRGSVEVTRRNLFGLDRSLSAFVRYSFRGSRLLATFREPWLFGRRQEFFATVFREEEDRSAFDFVRGGALVQTVRQRGAWSLSLRYTYQLTDTFNIVNPDDVGREFATSTVAGPSASVVNDTRDDPLDPHRGRFASADVQLSHAVLGGDSFVKGFLQASTYERLAARVVLALSARVGLARTFGESPLFLPRPDRFYAGGDYSLRGFALDTVGPLAPGSSGELVPVGGNAVLLGGAELRVDTGRYFSLAAFADAGNVYPLVSDLDPGELRYTAGLGVRYRSALGPLRVDWGRKLNPRPGESGYRFHFALGYAF
ncbi:MAG TPA: BamA/TamA family outer membrane protein [Vicinamibacteria bacterium]|nr:BamA/TamA family outer membrane protein [Vicinamibacteria bacterium]